MQPLSQTPSHSISQPARPAQPRFAHPTSQPPSPATPAAPAHGGFTQTLARIPLARVHNIVFSAAIQILLGGRELVSDTFAAGSGILGAQQGRSTHIWGEKKEGEMYCGKAIGEIQYILVLAEFVGTKNNLVAPSPWQETPFFANLQKILLCVMLYFIDTCCLPPSGQHDVSHAVWENVKWNIRNDLTLV